MRKRIEELFGEAKEFMGLRRAKFRRHRFVREQVLMTATVQNIKRMAKLLSLRAPMRGAKERLLRVGDGMRHLIKQALEKMGTKMTLWGDCFRPT